MGKVGTYYICTLESHKKRQVGFGIKINQWEDIYFKGQDIYNKAFFILSNA